MRLITRFWQWSKDLLRKSRTRRPSERRPSEAWKKERQLGRSMRKSRPATSSLERQWIEILGSLSVYEKERRRGIVKAQGLGWSA
ncbi:unnamed protein product [Linum trigynum]|uniref:Uncharacterized protein n=1 Tax=Linum trigynum TaxID=586398 RepID=A0AAV2E7X8_9ROSI